MDRQGFMTALWICVSRPKLNPRYPPFLGDRSTDSPFPFIAPVQYLLSTRVTCVSLSLLSRFCVGEEPASAGLRVSVGTQVDWPVFMHFKCYSKIPSQHPLACLKLPHGTLPSQAEFPSPNAPSLMAASL